MHEAPHPALQSPHFVREMANRTDTILLPVETQTRELDAKLLLGCFLAELGVPSIVGSRIEMHLYINRLPVGLYHAKDVRRPSHRVLAIMRKLGHTISVLDEEAVVYYAPSSYHQHRVSDRVMAQVDDFFAWGDDNRKLIETAPGYRNQPIHVAGNPRIDFLRPELRAYFEPEVDEYRRRFGKFVLINSNFGSVNHFFPNLSRANEDGVITSGNVAPESFMAGVYQFRFRMLEAFRDALPQLADAFPDTPVIVRPHPAENHDTWRKAAAGRKNVQVIHENNVYGWLMASSAKIHNGCTTAIESYLLGQPSICYAPISDAEYELSLPNSLSHRVDSVDALIARVGTQLEGGDRHSGTDDQSAIASQYFEALDGPLAAERTAETLAGILRDRSSRPRPSPVDRVTAHAAATFRRLEKQINSKRTAHKNSDSYSRHRFPGVDKAEVERRIARYGELLGRFGGIRVEPAGENLFRLEKP